MELKQQYELQVDETGILLIELYGIETCCLRMGAEELLLLIELYGIETAIVPDTIQNTILLIELYGIETRTIVGHRTGNRTF